MKQTIRAGTTVHSSGTLGRGDTLTADAGAVGALLYAETGAVNHGFLHLLGGAIRSSHGATLVDQGSMTSTGKIAVDGGRNHGGAAYLDVSGSLVNRGVLLATAGYNAAGGLIAIDAHAVLSNAGTIALNAGTASLSAGVLMDFGNLVNTGRIALGASTAVGGAGATLDVGGTLTNQGSIVLEGGYNYTQNFNDRSNTLAVSGVLVNSGMITLNGTLADAGSVQNAGTITVAGAYYRYGTDIDTAATIAVSGSLSNTGLIEISGGYPAIFDYGAVGDGGLLLDSGTLSNAGTVELLGTAALLDDTGVLVNTGLIAVDVGADLDVTGTASNAGLIRVGGVGYGDRGGLLAVAGVMTNTGTISLLGGARSYGPYGGFYDTAGGAMTVSGSTENDGSIMVAGGLGAPPGRSGGYGAFGAFLAVSGSMVNVGTLHIEAGMRSTYDTYGTGGTVSITGSFRNAEYQTGTTIVIDGSSYPGASGALIIAAGAFMFSTKAITGSGLLINRGYLTVGERGHTSGVTIENSGTIGISEHAVISSAITSDGTLGGVIALSAFSQLDLDGAVGASQTVLFGNGESEALGIGRVDMFAGVLSNIGNTSTLDFLHQTVTAASTYGDTLALSIAGKGVIDLTLAAPLQDGASLMLSHDRGDGTDLTFHI